MQFVRRMKHFFLRLLVVEVMIFETRKREAQVFHDHAIYSEELPFVKQKLHGGLLQMTDVGFGTT